MVIQGKEASWKKPGGLRKVRREVEPLVREIYCSFFLALKPHMYNCGRSKFCELTRRKVDRVIPKRH